MNVINVNETPIKEKYEEALRELSQYDRKVTEKEWLKIAKEKNLLSAVSMKGYSKSSWGEIFRDAKRKYINIK